MANLRERASGIAAINNPAGALAGNVTAGIGKSIAGALGLTDREAIIFDVIDDDVKKKIKGYSPVELYINPRRIQIPENKLTSKQITMNRIVTQHFGPDDIDISMSGSTGYLHAKHAGQVAQFLGDMTKFGAQSLGGNIGRGKSTGSGAETVGNIGAELIGTTGNVLSKIFQIKPYDTPAYKALIRLQIMYRGDDIEDSDIALKQRRIPVRMIYRGSQYYGHFKNFTFQEIEDSPWAWEYSLVFTAKNFSYREGDVNWISTISKGFGKLNQVMDSPLTAVKGVFS